MRLKELEGKILVEQGRMKNAFRDKDQIASIQRGIDAIEATIEAEGLRGIDKNAEPEASVAAHPRFQTAQAKQK